MSSVVPINNTTFIRPLYFYISGFNNVPFANYYYMFLCFVYIMTVLGNSVIMGTIYLARSLHTAKYIAVFNLALTDLCGSSALIPKYAEMFLSENQNISYEGCLANMFFVYLFIAQQSLSLLALAFDRVIAICFPLRYHAIVTKTLMTLMLAGMWVFSVFVVTTLVALITRLSFCRSIIIPSYFCDHGPVFRLACNDHSPNSIMGYAYVTVVLVIPMVLIGFSYACIGFALLKISRGPERMKAMKTCTSHLILVAMFYLPLGSVYASAVTTNVPQNTRIINSVLTQTVPPMLNPIIYTLKTEEVLQSIKGLYKQYQANSIMDKPVT